MSSKAAVPPLTSEQIKSILCKSFPSFSPDSSISFSSLAGGVINLAYRVDILESPSIPSPLVIKILSKAWGIAKFQNELAITQFVHENIGEVLYALLGSKQTFVPKIYHAESGQDLWFIVMEYIHGVTRASISTPIPPEAEQLFMRQMSAFYCALKSFSFTSDSQIMGSFKTLSVERFNGLPTLKVKATHSNDIATNAKPVDNFKGWFTSTIDSRTQGIKERIPVEPEFYRFMLATIEEICTGAYKFQLLDDLTCASTDRLCICHCDLSQANVMVDPNTLELTAVIDWEWAMSNFLEWDLHMLLDWDIAVPKDKGKMSEFMEHVNTHWKKLVDAFPNAKLGSIVYPTTNTKGKRLRYFERVSELATLAEKFHEWDPEDWRNEIENVKSKATQLKTEFYELLAQELN